jgi:hypothetical protein
VRKNIKNHLELNEKPVKTAVLMEFRLDVKINNIIEGLFHFEVEKKSVTHNYYLRFFLIFEENKSK